MHAIGILKAKSTTGSTWSPDWQNLGGSLASPPVAATWGPNRLDVFAVDTGGGLIHRWWDGELWNDWEDLGGSLAEGSFSRRTRSAARDKLFFPSRLQPRLPHVPGAGSGKAQAHRAPCRRQWFY